MKKPESLKSICCRNRHNVLVPVLVLLLFTKPFLFRANAEYYRYTDQSGVVCFTDDLTTVPLETRMKIESYRGITTVAAPEGVGEVREDEPGLEGEPESAPEASDVEVSALRQEKERLDAEYLFLKQQRDDLMKEGRQKLTGDDFKAYNVKVGEFNDRMREFEEKKNSYLDRVRVYYQSGE
jgi:hypothetical protein